MSPAHLRAVAALVFAAALAACSSRPPPGMRQEEEWHAPVQILLHYAGPDGRVTRAQLEAGLRKDFDAADRNHDGVLEPDEVRTVNDQRWKEDQSAVSPLQDWNGDGVVDFDEFAGTARALFQDYDRNHDGVLTPQELHPGRPGQPGQPGGGERQGRGPRGGGAEGQ